MDKKNNNLATAVSAVFVCVVTGVQFAVTKYAVREINSPLLFLWARLFTAFLSAYAYAKIKKLRLVLRPSVMILSFIHPFSAFFLQSASMKVTDTAVAGVITALSPAVTTLMAFVSGEEKFTFRRAVSVAGIILGGLVCADFPGSTSGYFTFGSLLMLAAIFLRGIYYVSVHRLSGKIPHGELTYSQITFSFLFCTVALLFTGSGDISVFAKLSMPAVISVAYMGIISTTAVFFVNNYLLSRLPVSVSASLMAVTFVINLTSAAFLSGEEIPTRVLSGSAVIITFVILLAGSKGKSFADKSEK